MLALWPDKPAMKQPRTSKAPQEFNPDGLRAMVVGIIHQAVIDCQLLQRRGVITSDLKLVPVKRSDDGKRLLRVDGETIGGISPVPINKESAQVEVFAKELLQFLLHDMDDFITNSGIDLEPEAVRRGLRRTVTPHVSGMNWRHQRPERALPEKGNMRYATTKGMKMGKAPTQGIKRHV